MNGPPGSLLPTLHILMYCCSDDPWPLPLMPTCSRGSMHTSLLCTVTYVFCRLTPLHHMVTSLFIVQSLLKLLKHFTHWTPITCKVLYELLYTHDIILTTTCRKYKHLYLPDSEREKGGSKVTWSKEFRSQTVHEDSCPGVEDSNPTLFPTGSSPSDLCISRTSIVSVTQGCTYNTSVEGITLRCTARNSRIPCICLEVVMGEKLDSGIRSIHTRAPAGGTLLKCPWGFCRFC